MPQQVLRILQENNGFCSGEDISAELGITRAAVWKKIEALRKGGFIIDAVPSKGYKLVSSPDLSREEILRHVNRQIWKQIFYYDTVDSTNEHAASLLQQGGVIAGTVIIADKQESGRGRLGRKWISPAGSNIYMSIIIQPEILPRDATLITILAAVVCWQAIQTASGLNISIKWPNDLMVAGKKIGGILTEMRSDPDKIQAAIVGIGINVNMPSSELPEEVKALATSIKEETGRGYSRSSIAVEILRAWEQWYHLLVTEGKSRLLLEWKRRSSTLGKAVRVTLGDKMITGYAEDIDEEGMLMLRLHSGVLQKISSGDLTFLR